MEWTTEVGCAYSATITVGTITDTGNVTIQLKDFAGNALTVPNGVMVYFTTDAAGQTIETLGAEATITTHGICNVVTATSVYYCISEATGLIDLTLDGDYGNSATVYLHVVLPNGKIVHSAVITFTS